MLCQTEIGGDKWNRKHGLSFPSDDSLIDRAIDDCLASARKASADLVVFPELSVPAELLERVRVWSENARAVVVAGSHYFFDGHKHISRCPVIIAGKVYFVHKLVPSPHEVSPIRGEGLSPGTELAVFEGTTIGRFAVLICSDYLDLSLRSEILRHELDVLIVIACQADSEAYHARMSIDCDEARHGLYCLYVNLVTPHHGDGKSAVFAVVDKLFERQLHDHGWTDGAIRNKACQLYATEDRVIVELNLHHKRPEIPHTVHSRPNIIVSPRESNFDTSLRDFTRAIANDDERYRRIESLYVKPREYDDIIEKLERRHIVFIVGDPGIGKTYTAIHLLLRYYSRGYTPRWFTGLDKTERALQRQVIRQFVPQKRQVVYFEDPFGRTTFEDRDTLHQVLGPLLDTVADIDARIIITSRREVFEQFATRSLRREELWQFAEDMGIVKPSYSPEALTLMLERIAQNACRWYTNAECKEFVARRLKRAELVTPLSVRDLVVSTAQVESIDELRKRLDRRRVDTQLEFAREIDEAALDVKLCLAAVFLFGYRGHSALGDWFGAAHAFLNGGSELNGRTAFREAVKQQLGHRLEYYGAGGFALRFLHPMYEEAFGVVAAKDPTTQEALSTLVRLVAHRQLRVCAHDVARQLGRYPVLTMQLVDELLPVVRGKRSIADVAVVGMRLIGAYDTSRDPALLEVMKRLASPTEMAQLINDEEDVRVMNSALRLAYGYEERLHDAEPSKWLPQSISSRIDWRKLFGRIRRYRRFAGLSAALKWSAILARSEFDEFIASVPKRDLRRMYGELGKDQRKQLRALVRDSGVRAFLGQIPLTAENPRSRLRSNPARLTVEAGSNSLVIDDGAVAALRSVGRSLLPVGVVEINGDFVERELVTMRDMSNGVIGWGLVEYAADDIRVIRGQQSAKITSILGFTHGPAVIEHHLMVVL